MKNCNISIYFCRSTFSTSLSTPHSFVQRSSLYLTLLLSTRPQHFLPTRQLSVPEKRVNRVTKVPGFALKNCSFVYFLSFVPPDSVKKAPFCSRSPSDFQTQFLYSPSSAYSLFVTCIIYGTNMSHNC